MSLAVPAVYSIPMLLLVGWRGEPGKRDEPQHLHQGQATPGLLGEAILSHVRLILPSLSKTSFVFFTVSKLSEIDGWAY